MKKSDKIRALVADKAPCDNKKQRSLDFDKDIAKFTPRQMEACAAIDSGLYKFLLYGGALGGGKSYFLRWVAVRLLMGWFFEKGLREVKVMLCCEDYPQLKDRHRVIISQEIARADFLRFDALREYLIDSVNDWLP